MEDCKHEWEKLGERGYPVCIQCGRRGENPPSRPEKPASPNADLIAAIGALVRQMQAESEAELQLTLYQSYYQANVPNPLNMSDEAEAELSRLWANHEDALRRAAGLCERRPA